VRTGRVISHKTSKRGALVGKDVKYRVQLGDLKKARDLLQITKLYTVFDVFTDESTALRSFV